MSKKTELYIVLSRLLDVGMKAAYEAPAYSSIVSCFKNDFTTIQENSIEEIRPVIAQITDNDHQKSRYLSNSIVDAIEISSVEAEQDHVDEDIKDLPLRLKAKSLEYAQNNDKVSSVSLEKRMSR